MSLIIHMRVALRLIHQSLNDGTKRSTECIKFKTVNSPSAKIHQLDFPTRHNDNANKGLSTTRPTTQSICQPDSGKLSIHRNSFLAPHHPSFWGKMSGWLMDGSYDVSTYVKITVEVFFFITATATEKGDFCPSLTRQCLKCSLRKNFFPSSEKKWPS